MNTLNEKPDTITLYGITWCLDCKRAKKFFGEQRVPYISIDTEQKPEAMEFVEKVKAESKGGTIYVQTRGISRNEMWVLAYDLYPVRVVGRFLEEGGKADDPVLPEAHWVITQDKHKLGLERVK